MIELYLGKLSPSEIFSAAAKPEEQCEAQFNIGEWNLLHGDRAGAATALRMVADSCLKLFFEYVGAVAGGGAEATDVLAQRAFRILHD